MLQSRPQYYFAFMLCPTNDYLQCLLVSIISCIGLSWYPFKKLILYLEGVISSYFTLGPVSWCGSCIQEWFIYSQYHQFYFHVFHDPLFLLFLLSLSCPYFHISYTLSLSIFVCLHVCVTIYLFPMICSVLWTSHQLTCYRQQLTCCCLLSSQTDLFVITFWPVRVEFADQPPVLQPFYDVLRSMWTSHQYILGWLNNSLVFMVYLCLCIWHTLFILSNLTYINLN